MTTLMAPTDARSHAAAAREQIITALGLANQAKAVLETVRDTTDRGTHPHTDCARAWRVMHQVTDGLKRAEAELRGFDPPNGLPEARARTALNCMLGLDGRVRSAQRMVTTAMRSANCPEMLVLYWTGSQPSAIVAAVLAPVEPLERLNAALGA